MIEADGQGSDAGPIEDGKTGMQRAWAAHMAGLRASYQRHVTQQPAKKDTRIEQLLDPILSKHSENMTNWAIPNEIEILLVQLKTGPDLEVALDSAMLTAEKINVPSFAVMSKRRAGLATDDEKQALLAKLLRDTHNRYAARRSERVMRREVALRMAKLGLILTILIALVLIVLGIGFDYKDKAGGVQHIDYALLAKYNVAVAAFFGVLGAYLSRLIAFQNGAPNLSFDDLENGYAPHFIFVRLLVGGLCALVLYFIIAGQLIGGELFPSPSGTGGFGELWLTYVVEDKVKNPGGVNYSGPSANFAKLIIWSFIAGFSERFLPDSLSTLEARSRIKT